MSTDEQKEMLGQAVLDLRDKETEQRCLHRKADIFIEALHKVIECYQIGQHDRRLLEALKSLPPTDEITQTFQGVVQVKEDIQGLKKTLDIK